VNKIRVFISSVQSEFHAERSLLYEYIISDPLLGKFFDPFIFEILPAKDQKSDSAYLKQVKQSDIYIGIFGKQYGSKDQNGISPTENEFNLAGDKGKTRLIFISQHNNNERDPKELALIRKAEAELIRKKFSSPSELKTAVYASLINYLEDKEYLRTGPFDASICGNSSLNDLDKERISQFVALAKSKRGFPLSDKADSKKILTHLNLLNDGTLTNAALLLFGKDPQRFFITSELKCAQFYGNDIVKPIPAYQVYKGDVFQLVDQAVDFVLSRVNARVGTRSKSVDAPFDYEIPRAAVAEAIVNAVAHRDYTSNASVQVMLFRNRLEIWNPGQLPDKLTIEKLKQPHSSFPANPLLAEPMYLAGYIERLGTGIPDMINLCKKAGLKEPDFKIEDVFQTIIYRSEKSGVQVAPQAAPQVSGEVTGEVTEEVRRVVLALNGEMKRADIQKLLQLKHDDFFRVNYIIPSLNSGYVEMKYPNRPNHPNQRYSLTAKGERLKTKLKNEINKK
jgi:predicted HTH transcriptional regulator